eukprot:2760458-Amphidinium_carterae.1
MEPRMVQAATVVAVLETFVAELRLDLGNQQLPCHCLHCYEMDPTMMLVATFVAVLQTFVAELELDLGKVCSCSSCLHQDD